MNKKAIGPDLSKVINRAAHSMMAQSFSIFRLELERKAMAMLRDGKAQNEIASAIYREALPTVLRHLEKDF